MRTLGRILLALTLIAACARGALFAQAEDGAPPALTVNGVNASRAEATFYMLSAQNGYRDVAAYYRDFLGIDYWNLADASGVTVFEMVKADVFRELLMMNVFYSRAESMGVKLLDADVSACQADAARILLSLNGEQARALTRADIEQVLMKQLLADRVYGLLVAQTPIDEASVRDGVNADECVQYDMEYLFMLNAEAAADGRLTPLTGEKKARQIEALTQAARAGEWESANEASAAGVCYGTLTFLSGNTDIDDKLISAAAVLAPGEASGVIETDAGWFILRMIDNSSEDGYRQAVENALTSARKAAFQAEYDRIYAETSYEFDVNFWDTLSPGGDEDISD